MNTLASTAALAGFRIVAVHAHPDDESLWTGGALATLARAGAHVTVVTCTLGEEGEVIGDTYQHLTVDHADQLGGFRIAELSDALSILGVHGIHLGAAGRYRDSGMAGSPAHDNPRAFVNNLDDATQDLSTVLRELRPHAVLTYGPDGGYGHPDHIAAHDITHAAVSQLRAEGEWAVPRIWWSTTPREPVDAALDAMTPPGGWEPAPAAYLDAATDSHYDIALRLAPAAYDVKRRAMAAHATQIWMADGTVTHTNPTPAYSTGRAESASVAFALSNLYLMPLLDTEYYQLGEGILPRTPVADGLLDSEDLA